MSIIGLGDYFIIIDHNRIKNIMQHYFRWNISFKISLKGNVWNSRNIMYFYYLSMRWYFRSWWLVTLFAPSPAPGYYSISLEARLHDEVHPPDLPSYVRQYLVIKIWGVVFSSAVWAAFSVWFCVYLSVSCQQIQ